MVSKFKSALPHILIVIAFIALAIIYVKPILNNKVLFQYDLMQFEGSSKEVVDFEKKTGESSLWTNSMFGGMPTYTITAKYPFSLTSNLASKISYLLPDPANYIFFLLLGVYIMLAGLGFNPWLSALGAVGFAFSSYNLISLEAGHASKVLAIAYAPPLITGLILLLRGHYVKGTIIAGIFFILELYSNHVQITYYLFIALFLLGVYEFINSIIHKRLNQFFVGALIMVGIVVLGVGSMASKLWPVYEYSKYTIRGASELKSNTQSQGGLDKDYAYSWSYGIGETFTFLIPDWYGGASQGEVGQNSKTYKVVKKLGGAEAAKSFTSRLPLYWGSQPNTGGPAYLGAIICFLFILSFFVVKNQLKWWALGVVILFTMLSWGKNFYFLTDLFFYHVPMYNKFRAVTMIHSMVAIIMVLMGMWAVKVIIENKLTESESLKYLKITTIAVGGFLLFLALFAGQLFSFEKMKDSDEKDAKGGDEYFVSNLEQMTGDKEVANQIYEAVLEDRASLLKNDSIRSFVFILLAAAVLWFFIKGKYKAEVVYVVLILLVLTDMWMVAKRYLNNDDFIPKKKYQTQFEQSEADKVILEDKDPDFRVMNTTVSTFNDATTSYFHKSIGGYSAAKMRRYQDLIEKHISEGNMNVLNMLNTKYFIQQGKDGNPVAARNPGALGHAWFVNEIIWVNNPDEEINALKDFNPQKTAVIDKKYQDKIGSFRPSTDSSSSITLVEYKPNHLTYEINGSSQQLAIFSEIYYNNELGWESYIDGKEAKHLRADYILRAMVVPAGKHKIEFKFHPKSYYSGEKISLVCSIILLGGIIGLTVIKIRNPKEDNFDLD